MVFPAPIRFAPFEFPTIDRKMRSRKIVNTSAGHARFRRNCTTLLDRSILSSRVIKMN